MIMRLHCQAISACVIALAGLLACGGEPSAEGERMGTSSTALVRVPADVECIRLELSGDVSATEDSDVTPLSSVSLTLGALPTGTITLSGAAFTSPCATAQGDPTWIADPVQSQVLSGIAVSIPLTFRKSVADTVQPNFVVPAVALAAGASSTYAVLADGSAWAWGANSSGQLGLGDAVARAVPSQITALDALGKTSQIAAGGDFACAADDTNMHIYCWGNNAHGQLGDDTTSSRQAPTSARGIGLSFPELEIVAGSHHACVRFTPDNHPNTYCWGANNLGQLGDGTTTDRHLPTAISSTAPRFVHLAAGGDTTCGTAEDGTVYCWGSNIEGQFGDTTFMTNATRPSATRHKPGVGLSVGAGLRADHVCSMDGAGRAHCSGAAGMLGNGSTAASTVPVDVSGLTQATGVALGAMHSCAWQSTGRARCWGSNDNGELGDGTAQSRTASTQVASLTDVVSMALGAEHSCALRVDGATLCWGRNDSGQVGDGTNTARFAPTLCAF